MLFRSLKSPWLVMDAFIAQDGHLVMLALLNVAPGDRHFHDCVPASLSVLRAATLHPGARTATAAAVLSDPSHVPAMQVLMDIAARAAGAQDSEAVIDALHVVCNLVAPPPNMGAVASAATAGSRSGRSRSRARRPCRHKPDVVTRRSKGLTWRDGAWSVAQAAQLARPLRLRVLLPTSACRRHSHLMPTENAARDTQDRSVGLVRHAQAGLSKIARAVLHAQLAQATHIHRWAVRAPRLANAMLGTQALTAVHAKRDRKSVV